MIPHDPNGKHRVLLPNSRQPDDCDDMPMPGPVWCPMHGNYFPLLQAGEPEPGCPLCNYAGNKEAAIDHLNALGRIDNLEHQLMEQHGHFLNFANTIGAKDGQDMLELLYGFFARIRCACGHPADDHYEETGCSRPDPLHGYCQCNNLRLCLWSTSGDPEMDKQNVSEQYKRVVGEMNLDTTDIFTRVMAMMFSFHDAHVDKGAALERCQEEVHRLRDEVQKLRAVNAALVAALELIASGLDADGRTLDGMTKATAAKKARAAIAQAEQGTKDGAS